MSAGLASIEEICHADHERLARMVREQPTVTREAWDEQVKLFKIVGASTYTISDSAAATSSLKHTCC